MRLLPALTILPGLLCLAPGPALAEMNPNAGRLAAKQEENVTGLPRKHVEGIGGVSDPVALKHSASPEPGRFPSAGVARG